MEAGAMSLACSPRVEEGKEGITYTQVPLKQRGPQGRE